MNVIRLDRGDTDEELVDPATADDHQIVRMMKLLHHLRLEHHALEALFADEIGLLERQATEACQPIANRIADLEKVLGDYLRFRQAQDEKDGRPPRKSMRLPWGTIQSRASTKIELDGADVPALFQRLRVELDREKVKAALKAGALASTERGCVTADGELLPVRVVESVGYSVKTDTP